MINRFWLACAICFLASHAAFAARVNSIYQASVPLVSQSDQARKQAIPVGLAQVLIKLSGNSLILDNPKIKPALAKADTLVEEWSYATPLLPNPSAPYLLKIHFDPEGINRILRDAGVPAWGQERPLILSWVEFEAPNRPAEIIGADTPGEIPLLFKQNADRRGLALMLPVMDVADMNVVHVNDIVMMTIPPLQQAATRYASDAILIARILPLQVGFSVHAKLVMGSDQWDWNVTGNTLADALSTLTNKVADTLASRYAVVMTNIVKTTLTVRVLSVSQQDDFSDLMQYMQHLAPVADVQLVQVTEDQVTLNVNLRGSKQSFMDALASEQHLIPVVSDAKNTNALVYKWHP